MKLAYAVIAAMALSSTAVLANDKSSQSPQSSQSSSSSTQSAGASDVRDAQQALKDKGIDLTVDGKMGPKTQAAASRIPSRSSGW